MLDTLLPETPGVKPGKMFGFPAYYVKEKLFACLYEGGVGIKVPEKRAKELVDQEGIIPFQPWAAGK